MEVGWGNLAQWPNLTLHDTVNIAYPSTNLIINKYFILIIILRTSSANLYNNLQSAFLFQEAEQFGSSVDVNLKICSFGIKNTRLGISFIYLISITFGNVCMKHCNHFLKNIFPSTSENYLIKL